MPARDTSWAAFLELARPALVLDGYTLCLDPGETTGWSLWDGPEMAECGQWATPSPDILADAIFALDAVYRLDRIVYEEYRVRGNKYKEHVGSEVVTIQHIGAIKVVASESNIDVPVFKQGAGIAKNFATDTKLRRWGLYQVGMRHANDSIRHGVYWILFASGKSDPRHRSVDPDT